MPLAEMAYAEVKRLMKAARGGGRVTAYQHDTDRLPAWPAGERDREHRMAAVELGRAASLHVRRAKNGKASAHPLRGDEVRALRELRRQYSSSAFVFATERGGPFTPDAINRLVKRIGARARFA